MTKNFFIFLVLILFVGAAVWLLFKKGSDVNQPSASPSVSVSANTSPMITTLPSGLKIEDVKVGTGKEAKSGDNVTVHYVGTLSSGQKFDSSYDRGEPATFAIGVGQLIKGWDQGIPGMKVGGKRKLTIPPELAYGAGGIPTRDARGRVIQGKYMIPPNSVLLFEIELLEVISR